MPDMSADPSHRGREILSDDDLDLAPGTDRPFLFDPPVGLTPLVVSFPHVGLEWPREFFRPRPQVNFGRNADYEVHTLYNTAQRLGAARVRARYSRLLVDLNRAHDDVSPTLVPDHPAPRPRQRLFTRGSKRSRRKNSVRRASAVALPNRGVVWDTAVGNIPILVPPLPYEELEHRISRYYDPYYRAVDLLLQRRRRQFGYAILLEAHSMPSSVKGDLILGTLEGGSCSSQVQADALTALRGGASGLDVRLNDPYRGGELVRRFGRPEEGLHALQLEVSRGLYMDEHSLKLWPHSRAGSASSSHELKSNSGRAASRPDRHERARLGELLGCIETLVQVLATPRSMCQPRTPPRQGHAPRPEHDGARPRTEELSEPVGSLVSSERERINSRPVTRDAKERTRGSE